MTYTCTCTCTCRVLLLIFVSSYFQVANAAGNHGDWCSCGKHSILPIHFNIEHSSTVWIDEANTALSYWNSYSNIFTSSIGNGSAGDNGVNEIIFFDSATTKDLYGFTIDSGTFGVAFVDPPSAFGNFNECPAPSGVSCGTFTETDIIINADYAQGWTSSAPRYDDSGAANYVATAIHELGHALGMHHNFDTMSTMNYYEDYAAQYLTQSDAQAVRGIYPGRVRNTVDIAIFPFRFSGFKYSGTTVASANPTTVEAGDNITIKNFTIENLGTTSLTDVNIELYLSSNTTITETDYLLGSVSFSTFNTWWDDDGNGRTFQVPASTPSGRYYIGAIAHYDNTREDTITHNNKWILDATRQVVVIDSIGGADGYESDDSSAEATTISSGVTQDHSIVPSNDVDWVRFTLNTTSAVSIETFGSSGDTRIWLYDNSLNQLDFNDDNGQSLFSLINRTCEANALTAGTYFVKVDEFNNDNTIENYEISLDVTSCATSTDNYEPDDTQHKLLLLPLEQLKRIV